MTYALFLFFLLLQLLHTSVHDDLFLCQLKMKPGIKKEGDLGLGAFFTIYYLNQEKSMIRDYFLMRPHQNIISQRWLWRNYQHVLAFYFAIEEINRDPHLLPNLSLGFQIYNAFPSDRTTLNPAVIWLSGGDELLPNYECNSQHRSVAAITGTSATFSAQIGTLLKLFKTPQVTYGPFDAVLSDKELFPSLYQLAPDDSSLAPGMVSLLLHFDWNWVAVFISDDLRGEKFLQHLNVEMVKKDICVALTQKLPDTKIMSASSIVTSMKRFSISPANVHVHILYGEAESLMMVELAADHFLTTGKVWIMADKWDIAQFEKELMFHSFHGSFSFSHHKEEIPGFKHFLKTVQPFQYPEDFYFSKVWVDLFQCSPAGSFCGKIGECLPNTSLGSTLPFLNMMTISDTSYFVYNAVYAVAYVLHKMILEKIARQTPEDAEQLRPCPWQLHPFLKKLQFTNSAGQHISLDEKGNHVVQYDIQNDVNFPGGLGLLVKVGEFFSESAFHQGLVINEDIIEWPIGFTQTPQSVCSQSCGPGFRRIPEEGRPVCCFICVLCPEGHISNTTDTNRCTQCPLHKYPNTERSRCLPKVVTFLAYEDPLGTALASAALGFSALTVGVLGVFVKHRDSAIVKTNNRTLSYVLLVSLTFCFLCSLLFIGRPNTATCILQQITFGVMFTVAVSTVLAKTVTVVRILQQITFGVMFTVAVSTVLAKTVTVVLAFKATGPGRRMRQLLVSGAPNFLIPICSLIQMMLCAIWLGTSPPFIDTDAHSEHGHIIIVCNKGSVIAFYCVLGYLGSLALGSFTVAFLARNLPDTFNEAKFLTFSALLFCSVWVTFLPVYHSSKGKAMVAVEVFSILASSVGLLGCIFAPKCYIILMRPDRNSLKGLKDRSSRRNRHSEGFSHKSPSCL